MQKSITNKVSELGRLQDLTLIINRPVSISASSLTPLKQLPRLTKFCLEEEISNNIDVSQLTESDLIFFLIDMHLQHLHIRLSFLNDLGRKESRRKTRTSSTSPKRRTATSKRTSKKDLGITTPTYS
jgi:hypothetical protein